MIIRTKNSPSYCTRKSAFFFDFVFQIFKASVNRGIPSGDYQRDEDRQCDQPAGDAEFDDANAEHFLPDLDSPPRTRLADHPVGLVQFLCTGFKR
jgi:hypothetical protein